MLDIGPAEPFPGTERPPLKDITPQAEASTTQTEKATQALRGRRKKAADTETPQEPVSDVETTEDKPEAENVQEKADSAPNPGTSVDDPVDVADLRSKVSEAGKAMGLTLDDLQKRARCGIGQWTARTCNELLAQLNAEADAASSKEE